MDGYIALGRDLQGRAVCTYRGAVKVMEMFCMVRKSQLMASAPLSALVILICLLGESRQGSVGGEGAQYWVTASRAHKPPPATPQNHPVKDVKPGEAAIEGLSRCAARRWRRH